MNFDNCKIRKAGKNLFTLTGSNVSLDEITRGVQIKEYLQPFHLNVKIYQASNVKGQMSDSSKCCLLQLMSQGVKVSLKDAKPGHDGVSSQTLPTVPIATCTTPH